MPVDPHNLPPNVVARMNEADKRAFGLVARPAQAVPVTLKLVILGQVRGCGKNHVGVARSGARYALPLFAAWRDDAVRQIRQQTVACADVLPFGVPLIFHLNYYAGDHRRRDMPAILDGLFSVLEKAGIVRDDVLMRDCAGYYTRYDKENPRLEIEMKPA